jgi:hypothetical protein
MIGISAFLNMLDFFIFILEFDSTVKRFGLFVTVKFWVRCVYVVICFGHQTIFQTNTRKSVGGDVSPFAGHNIHDCCAGFALTHFPNESD